MAKAIDLDMKKRPVQRRALATVDAIVEAASQLLVTMPYESVTTNRIADRAGVGIGSLYQYFPNKEAIVTQVVAAWVDEMVAEVGAALDASVQHEIAAAALAIVSTLFDVVDRHRAQVQLILEGIPFAAQIPAIQALPPTLLALSVRSYASVGNRMRFARPEAATFVIMVMARASIIEAVLHCPPHLKRRDVEETIADFIVRIMVGNATEGMPA
ncbi:TetR/AcrR family transcriptional regulator [Oleomonas cavernae]|uniref:TetR/AcrR family transcriptional regulator n=1 Tax=Oleomonas cavernae TaxID=2320859 RepID=A0A418WEG4_9PROT|nr:TetR/AcrR family transcriptional regulator [Oleomonas cavernae]RJF88339.1 TetR/AcrR family transcriptional regulator [Oleomonas cavernae]